MDASLMIHFHEADEFEVTTEPQSQYVRVKLGGLGGWLTLWISPPLAEGIAHAITDELVPFEAGTFDRTSELGGELDQELGER